MPFRGGGAKGLPWAALLFPIVLYFLYVFYAGAVGWLGPDEPRYVSIGFAMARTGDWVTPRLWGEPWFEKPPLAYWLAAVGNLSGLPGEWGARVPIALTSIGFLGFYFWISRRIFSPAMAWIACVLLATCAGWVAFSHLAVTDLPLAATFSAALLLALWWAGEGPRWALPAAGACLGLAMLAKGLVPLALFAPLAVLHWRRWRALPAFAGPALIVALPWYSAMTLLHGRVFLDDFFWKHHFQRFSTDALQHGQPWWFYVPVLLAALLPWTPLVAKARPAAWWRDSHLRALLVVVVWGLVFFSASRAKLPGYLLPLLPALCILLAHSLEEAATLRRVLPTCILLLAFLPMTATLLPEALLSGLSRAKPSDVPWEYFAIVALPAAGVYWLERKGRRSSAFALAGLFVAGGFVWLKLSAFPLLDRRVTARGLALQVAPHAAHACVDGLQRGVWYGLNTYLNEALPDCEGSPRPFHVTADGVRYFVSQ